MTEKPKLVYDAPKHQYLYEWPDHYILEPVFDLTREYVEQLEAENAKLREACAELLKMAEFCNPEWLHWPEMHDELRKLGVEVE